ncbi:hypothetical protein NGB78_12865 [Staphylococcus arlettae]|uniref:hypothetical protein n=1 Tax=Staphylococcus TaxID=1279 RepID=UPI002DB5EEC4|nr:MULTISPECIES: hypothetical protein [Staphylococcus]MEB6244017.1 hypothetical protein [Staphylococcus gallinarum]MEB6297166.1 hypothetical protein [Staphylococcus gallinarum]MEB7422961.1 hypothetical protein [Staphylococcus arlettae]HCZ8106253.1 hypothetical protein [Staphylococcus aureus]
MTINFVFTFSVFDKTSKEISELCNIPNDQRIQNVIKTMKEQNISDTDFEFLKIYDFYFADNPDINF